MVSAHSNRLGIFVDSLPVELCFLHIAKVHLEVEFTISQIATRTGLCLCCRERNGYVAGLKITGKIRDVFNGSRTQSL